MKDEGSDPPNEDRGSSTEEYLPHTVGELRRLSGPIRVVDYDSGWPRRYELEANKIKSVLGSRALRIEHVGSTAVPEPPAKPIIDILLVVANSADETQYVQALETAAYQLHVREPGWHEHRMFKSSAMDLNLHVFSEGSTEIERMLAFRDWLRSNASDRELYALSKRALAQRDWKYTKNYADAKTAAIGIAWCTDGGLERQAEGCAAGPRAWTRDCSGISCSVNSRATRGCQGMPGGLRSHLAMA